MIGSRDGTGRGTEDQSQSFLKKKEEELRQKRERERQTAEAKSKQSADATFAVPSPAGVTGVRTATPTHKLEFVAVTTVPSPTETVSTSLISAPVRTAVTTTATSAANKIPKAVTASSVPPSVTAAPYQPAKPLSGANANIPQFYFPLGSPSSGDVDLEETAAKKVREEFEKIPDGQMGKNALAPVVKVCLHCCQ